MGLARILLDAIYPETFTCCLCEREARLDEEGICENCARALFHCHTLPPLPGLDGLTARWRFDNLTAPAIHRLKYQGKRYLARTLLQGASVPEGWPVQGLIPVPLSPARLRERGYNQCELLAKALSRQTGIPVLPLLRRTRDTVSQTTLTGEQRLKNLIGSMQSLPLAEGGRFLVLDDVITTGSTMLECARALRAVGAAQVYGWAVLIHPKLI